MGIGVATGVKASGGRGEMRDSSVLIRVEPTGRVKVYTEVSPHGQGTETTFAQIAADELGVSPDEVQVLHGDTDMLPSGQGTFASRGLTIGGSAMYMGLQAARHKMALIAAHSLECSPDDVVFQESKVFNRRDPEQAMAFAEVASAGYRAEALPPGAEMGLEFKIDYSLPGNTFGFAAHAAVVEIDRNTGEIKFLRYVAVHDPGRIINPMLTEGQIHGSIAQGLGQVLTEGMIYSPEGQPLTGSFLDYTIPTAEELPHLILDTTETPSPITPLGVKGIGELATVASPVAVANAVMDALSPLGIQHIDTPLTSEKIWRALQGQALSLLASVGRTKGWRRALWDRSTTTPRCM